MEKVKEVLITRAILNQAEIEVEIKNNIYGTHRDYIEHDNEIYIYVESKKELGDEDFMKNKIYLLYTVPVINSKTNELIKEKIMYVQIFNMCV